MRAFNALISLLSNGLSIFVWLHNLDPQPAPQRLELLAGKRIRGVVDPTARRSDQKTGQEGALRPRCARANITLIKPSLPRRVVDRHNQSELDGYLDKTTRATVNARLLPDLFGRAAEVPLRRLVQGRAAPRVEGLRRPYRTILATLHGHGSPRAYKFFRARCCSKVKTGCYTLYSLNLR